MRNSSSKEDVESKLDPGTSGPPPGRPVDSPRPQASRVVSRGNLSSPSPGPVEQPVQLSDFVGDLGAYQLALVALLFVRYVLLGLMANSGPLLTPDVTFYCDLPRQEILQLLPNISTLSEREQELEIKEEFKQVCQIDLHLYANVSLVNGAMKTKSQDKTTPLIVAAGQEKQQQQQRQQLRQLQYKQVDSSMGAAALPQPVTGLGGQVGSNSSIRECTEFNYQLAEDQGLTMTSKFDLVCDRDYLRSLFQSLLSASIVVAHVFWGTFSDKYGRFQAQRICLLVSLFSGLLSLFAQDYWSFAIMRALCSFGDLGMVVSLTTTVVELIGSKYRGLSVALVNFGSALGVTLLPYVVAYFEDFRQLVGLTVMCHMVTMPFVLATNESVRWLLTNRRFEQARRELKRIARWNRSSDSFLRSLGWLKFLMGASAPPATRAHGSRRRRRELFNSMFGEFVRQLEAQNMCDPAASSGEPLSSPSPAPQTAAHKFHFRTLDRDGGDAESSHKMKAPPQILISTIEPRDIETSASRGHQPPCNSGSRFFKSGSPSATGAESSSSSSTSSSSSSSSTSSSSASASPASAAASAKGARCANTAFADSSRRRRALNCTEPELLASGSARLLLPTVAVSQIETSGPISELLIANSLCRSLALPVPGPSAPSSVSSRTSEEEQYSSQRWRQHQWQLTRSGLEHELHQHQRQPDCINLVAHQLSFMGRVSRLFKDKRLMIAVFTIVWTTFNSELFYTSFIIINLEVGEDVYLNYALGGCMEALAAIMASLLLSYAPRRLSLIAIWLLISFACFGLSLAHIDSTWAVWMLALAKFAQSSLSSIASVAAYEAFPTFLRQSGSGLVFTLGMLGSVFAPFIFAEFDDHAGMDRVLMTFSFSSLTAATLIYLFLNETRDCELL